MPVLIKILNPDIEKLQFSWKATGSNGWIIDISNNPDLDDITPLGGLNIRVLNANDTGAIDLYRLSSSDLLELRLSGTKLNHLPDLDQLNNLRVLDISNTNIRNLSNLVKLSKLTTLDLSGIEGLTISQQLIWNRNLKLLTVPEAYRNDMTIKSLARRGVIIIYSDN